MNRRIAILPALLTALILAAPAMASASTPSSRALAFLNAHKSSGGCYAESGGSPSPSLSGWVVLGQRAAGASGTVGANCIASNLSRLSQPTDIELAILAIRAAGFSPRGVAGVNLVARLQNDVGRKGEIGNIANSHIFGVLAFRAAGQRLPRGAKAFLASSQLRDGSFGLSMGDSNLTASGIEALRAAGYPVRSKVVKRALTALLRFRNSDGGFGLTKFAGSDTQSTAWALQAYASVHASHSKNARRARRFLLKLQRRNGSFKYSRRSNITPVWVTAQALSGLAGKALPLR